MIISKYANEQEAMKVGIAGLEDEHAVTLSDAVLGFCKWSQTKPS